MIDGLNCYLACPRIPHTLSDDDLDRLLMLVEEVANNPHSQRIRGEAAVNIARLTDPENTDLYERFRRKVGPGDSDATAAPEEPAP